MEVTPVQPATEIPPRVEKPKIVRNREVDKAAAALAEEHVLPLPPGKRLTFEQMQEYLALLTPTMWDNVSVYVYRIKPKIIRQLSNPQLPNYIDCLGQPFDLDYIIARHGGGKYLLQVIDSEAKKDTASNQLFKCYFEVNEIEHPPILNFAELDMGASENKSYIAWLQNKGVLDAKGNIVQPSTPPPAPSTGLSAKDVLDILSYTSKLTTDQQNLLRSKIAPEDSLGKSIGDILLEKMRQDDPAKQMQVVTGLLTAFQQIMGTSKPDSGIASVYDKLIQMQIEQRKADSEQRKNEFEWIKLLLENRANNNQHGTVADQFNQFREVFGFARELIQSNGSGGRRSGWDVAYDVGRDIGLPLIQTLGTTISNIMMLRRGGAAAPSVANPSPAAFDPYRDQNALRQHSQTVAAQQPQTPTPPTPQPPPPPAPMHPPGNPTTPNDLVNLFTQYGGIVINALNNGTRGFDFADYIAGLLGVATHAMIAGQGEDAIVTAMLSIPEMAMFGEARLRTFAHEFCHYQEFLEDQSEEPDDSLEEEEKPPIEVYRPPSRRRN